MNDYDLICADCRDVLPQLSDNSFDAVITDPPYGVDADFWDNGIPTQSFLLECLRVAQNTVLWFGAASTILDFANYNPRPDRMLIWAPSFTTSKTSKDGMYYRFHPIWLWQTAKSGKAITSDVIRDNTNVGKMKWYHSGTKPLSLMMKLVHAFSTGAVLDPFMGTGTTGVACRKLGRHFVGIDNVTEYCAIAKKRLESVNGHH